MALSIRVQLQKDLVARLNALPGWVVVHRSRENTLADTKPVHGILYVIGEEKSLATTGQYQGQLRLELMIVARVEDTNDSDDEGNPYFYLDRLVTLAEATIHNPDTWGAAPLFNDVRVEGHEALDPNEDNEIAARLFVTFTYRHNYQDPTLP